MDNFKGIDCPDNSHKANSVFKANTDRKPETADISGKPTVGKVISGSVKAAKKSPLRKLADIFLSGDTEDIKSQILFGIVVPTLKRMASEAFDYALNGTRTGKKIFDSPTENFTKYRMRFDERESSADILSRRQERCYIRDVYEVEDIILDNYGDADIVLEELYRQIERFGAATVADLYDAVGKTVLHTDYKYGWTSLKTAKIIKVSGGYLLRLPRVTPLER